MDAHAAGELKELVVRAAPELAGPRAAEHFNLFDARYADLLAALEHFKAAKNFDAGLLLAGGLYRYWLTRNKLADGRTWIVAFTDAPGTREPLPLATGLASASTLAFRMDDRAAARALGVRAIAAARESKDALVLVSALGALARVELREKQFEEVQRLAEEADRLAAELKSDPARLLPVHFLAVAHRMKGDLARAREHYLDNIARSERMQNMAMVVAEWHNLGNTELRLGNRDEARSLFVRWIARARESSYTSMMPFVCGDMGLLALADKKTERGAKLLGAADAAFRKSGSLPDPDDEAELERGRSLARDALGATAFDAAFAAGAEMGLDAAIELAVDEARA